MNSGRNVRPSRAERIAGTVPGKLRYPFPPRSRFLQGKPHYRESPNTCENGGLFGPKEGENVRIFEPLDYVRNYRIDRPGRNRDRPGPRFPKGEGIRGRKAARDPGRASRAQFPEPLPLPFVHSLPRSVMGAARIARGSHRKGDRPAPGPFHVGPREARIFTKIGTFPAFVEMGQGAVIFGRNGTRKAVFWSNFFTMGGHNDAVFVPFSRGKINPLFISIYS